MQQRSIRHVAIIASNAELFRFLYIFKSTSRCLLMTMYAQVEPGCYADILVLDFDPLLELHKLFEDVENVDAVFKEGQLVKVSGSFRQTSPGSELLAMTVGAGARLL